MLNCGLYGHKSRLDWTSKRIPGDVDPQPSRQPRNAITLCCLTLERSSSQTRAWKLVRLRLPPSEPCMHRCTTRSRSPLTTFAATLQSDEASPKHPGAHRHINKGATRANQSARPTETKPPLDQQRAPLRVSPFGYCQEGIGVSRPCSLRRWCWWWRWIVGGWLASGLAGWAAVSQALMPTKERRVQPDDSYGKQRPRPRKGPFGCTLRQSL